MKTIQCDQGANTCIVPVKAPGFALVFLTDSPAVEGEFPMTFATTARTKAINTATVDPEVLATSNGHSGKIRARLGSTSYGSRGEATGLRTIVPGAFILLSVVSGGVFLIMIGSYI